MKFTRREKKLFDELAYYTCLGTQYPYEKQTRMLRQIGLAIVVGAPLVGVIPPNIDRLKPLTLPIFFIYQENPGLTVEAFAESIKVFLDAQEKQRTQQEKRESERELAELKQKYDL